MIRGAGKLLPKDVIGAPARGPELKLIRPPHGRKPRKKADHRILFVFLAVVTLAVAALIYFALQKPEPAGMSQQLLTSLQSVYKQEGIERFIEEKQRLRKSLASSLAGSPHTDEHVEASNIALYLFPDILPSGDFERELGMEDWAPLQSAIEQAPGTADSRQAFEEMRANIWNYESPSRTAPNLSSEAKQVLQIYQSLSAP